MKALAVRNLKVWVGKKQLLYDVSLQAMQGNVVTLLGPNGAGKTTLLKTIIGLYPAPIPRPEHDDNLIIFDDQIINTWPIHRKISYGLAYLPQETSLFGSLTVLDNLQLVYEYHYYWRDKTKQAFAEERDHWLEQTSLTSTCWQYAATLSGGQKRKLEVVRALLMHPVMIMLDEPFAGVDPKSIYELKSIFTLLSKQGIGILISDHHVDQLFSIADFLYVLLHGKVVTSGKISDILKSDYTKEQYLGNQFYDEMVKRYTVAK